ncbi:hypothetical protein Tco_0246042 [Tanacetum coccineum]
MRLGDKSLTSDSSSSGLFLLEGPLQSRSKVVALCGYRIQFATHLRCGHNVLHLLAYDAHLNHVGIMSVMLCKKKEGFAVFLLCLAAMKWWIEYMWNGYCRLGRLKYMVNLDDIMTPFPDSWSMGLSVFCIVLGEKEEDSSMVINFSGKIVQYKIASKTLCILGDLGSLNNPVGCFQFIASYANV